MTVDGASFLGDVVATGVDATSTRSGDVTLAGFWVGQANLMQVRLCGAGSAGFDTVTAGFAG